MGDTLHKAGDQFDRVFFFGSESAMLTYYFKSEAHGRYELDIMRLPEGSYYGELCILLGTASYFSLKITPNHKDKKSEPITKNGQRVSIIYSIDADVFKELCQEYPEFSNNVYVRAEVREAYFKHMANKSIGEYSYNMKVIDFEK